MTRTQAFLAKAFLFTLLVVAPVALFCRQNWSRVSTLSFELGGKWELKEPLPIPALILLAFTGGLFVGFVALLQERFAARRRIGELESRLVRASADAAKGQPKSPQPATRQTQEWA
jgi:hypothetical protein